MVSRQRTFHSGQKARHGRSGTSASTLLALTAMATLSPHRAAADEGGVSFWVPGIYGSLAAVPGEPGFSFATTNYFTSVSAGKDVDFQLGGGVVAGLESQFDAQFFSETYVFATPVLGGRASLAMTELVGKNDTSVFGTLTGPFGRTISGERSDSATGFGDLYPVAAIRWNQGVNNFMTYLTGDIPVGLYDLQNLANIGIGHGAIDSGGGYTYFNPQTGNEFSAVIGATYNFMNPSTDYQNGIDGHLDLGASHFFTQNFSLGAVGYVYQQLTGDSGSGDKVGPFKSRVVGVGPQVTFLFPVGDMQGYINVKGYKEFDAHDRASGCNVWFTFSITPGAPKPAVVAKY